MIRVLSVYRSNTVKPIKVNAVYTHIARMVFRNTSVSSLNIDTP